MYHDIDMKQYCICNLNASVDGYAEYCTCNGCKIGMGDLPDMYARGPRAASPRNKGIHIRQIMNAHVSSVM